MKSVFNLYDQRGSILTVSYTKAEVWCSLFVYVYLWRGRKKRLVDTMPYHAFNKQWLPNNGIANEAESLTKVTTRLLILQTILLINIITRQWFRWMLPLIIWNQRINNVIAAVTEAAFSDQMQDIVLNYNCQPYTNSQLLHTYLPSITTYLGICIVNHLVPFYSRGANGEDFHFRKI